MFVFESISNRKNVNVIRTPANDEEDVFEADDDDAESESNTAPEAVTQLQPRKNQNQMPTISTKTHR